MGEAVVSESATDLGRLKPFDRRAWLVAGAAFGILTALSGLYGFHRDELYFLDCARHLQGGYVDQPILTPLLARVSLAVFGVWLFGLRLWASLAAAATVLIGALLAREMGGGRTAQLLAAVATATMPVLLVSGHMMGPTPLDILAWAGLSFVVVRIGRTGDPSGWITGGLILGVGLANKHSIGFFAVAIFLGGVLSGAERLVLNRYFLAGALIAAVFTVPDLLWQASHDWPTVTMTRALNAENGGAGNILNFVFGQLVMATVALLWVWVKGIRFLWCSGRPMWRALVWAYGLLFVFFALTTGAKTYYLAGAYVYLLAAGSVQLGGGLGERSLRRLFAWTALTTALAVPIVLPVLPASDIGWTYKVNTALAEQVGWPELVHSVATVWHSLPPEQRSRAVIFTADYGERARSTNWGVRAAFRSLSAPRTTSGSSVRATEGPLPSSPWPPGRSM